MLLGKARVHAENLGHKERGLVAAGAGADFQDDVLLVIGILGQQHHLDLFFHAGSRVFEARQLFLRHGANLGIALVQHALGIGNSWCACLSSRYFPTTASRSRWGLAVLWYFCWSVTSSGRLTGVQGLHNGFQSVLNGPT